MSSNDLSQKTIPIEQFTCSYDNKEDRIRVAINYQDAVKRVDFWITRSFLLRLLPAFAKFGSTQSQMDMANDGLNSHANDTKPTPTDNSMLELTKKEPILLENVSFSKNGETVILSFSSPSTPQYIATLTPHGVDSLAQLLIKTAPTYDWGIGPWW